MCGEGWLHTDQNTYENAVRDFRQYYRYLCQKSEREFAQRRTDISENTNDGASRSVRDLNNVIVMDAKKMVIDGHSSLKTRLYATVRAFVVRHCASAPVSPVTGGAEVRLRRHLNGKRENVGGTWSCSPIPGTDRSFGYRASLSNRSINYYVRIEHAPSVVTRNVVGSFAAVRANPFGRIHRGDIIIIIIRVARGRPGQLRTRI